ncbi:MAG: hypothetical protein JF628_14100 [Sphingomonas sp.]|nr:hypothetical protein [Sphingomonas sp.]
MRSASARADAAAAGASVIGVAPISAAQNGLSDEPPPPPFPDYPPEESEEPASLIDAIDPGRVYRAAQSVFGRQGMIGLLLNRTA